MTEPLEILAHLACFGTPPDAPTAFDLAVGLDHYRAHLERETLPFLTGGGCVLQFVYGQYGRGKTHFLQTVAELARRQGFVTAYVDCRMGHSPFKSLQETYQMIARAMQAMRCDEDPTPRQGAASVIANSLQASGRDINAQLQVIRDGAVLSPEFRNLVSAYATTCWSGQTSSSPEEELIALLHADPSYRLTLSSLYHTHPSLPRPIGKLGRRNAAVWLRSLLALPRLLGYPGLVLLFDETERGHSFGTGYSIAQQQHLANLRNFVDHMALGAFRGVSIHYAVVEDFIELARERLEALSQRIERVRVELDEPSAARRGNPRAVWVSLDELTQPSPQDPTFFVQLGAGIIEIGRQAGLAEALVPHLEAQFVQEARSSAESIFDGVVREFVKFAATAVAQQVKHHV
ncbi:hypothetical protein CKO25_09145 [Thiocapsa imhoffii]|uniref:ATP-binding protein n=1 Tax=Thiocapsa imhoffii TaxID=382777 RepID=A0A9X1B997_9GAMM|nr:BREX system ATP-binding domain-containing protein [Thiocapsa imhoffii]MBK1644811.1 hypothetical protein [Thiocapsa imhoffii]